MEYVEGRTSRGEFEERQVPLKAALQIGAKVAEALESGVQESSDSYLYYTKARRGEIWRTPVESGEETPIDPYATESPAEFFAVVSEAFFELPHLLHGEYPQVYAQLRDFYRQDPAARQPPPRDASGRRGPTWGSR